MESLTYMRAPDLPYEALPGGTGAGASRPGGGGADRRRLRRRRHHCWCCWLLLLLVVLAILRGDK